MHPLEKKINNLLHGKAFISRGETLVAGVSGGADSIALLHVLDSLSAEFSFSLVVVYFDHGLRPDESPLEIALVQGEAAKMGWPFCCGAGNVSGYAAEQKVSTEDAARTLRYAYLREVLADCGGSKIVVAHTADDQAEELLLRLIRGTGRKGLAGMEVLHEGMILRPFLEIPKDEILAYLRDKQVTFCEDSSNQDRTYLRNRVRLDLIPYLEKQFNPGIRKLLRQTSSLLQEEDLLLDKISSDAYDLVVSGENQLKLDCVLFMRQHIAVRRRIVEKMLLRMGNIPSFRQISQVLYLAGNCERLGSVHLGCGLRGEVEGEILKLSYPLGRQPLRGVLKDRNDGPFFELEIGGPGIYQLDAHRQVEVVRLAGLPEKTELSSSIYDYFDLDKISFPLKIRSRRPGDRFYPIGSPGHKKVGDFLTDMKLDVKLRSKIPLLEYNGEVAALLGIRVSERFRVHSSSRNILRIKVF